MTLYIGSLEVGRMVYCPECGSKKVVQKSEGKVCNKCGLVIEEGSFISGRRLLT